MSLSKFSRPQTSALLLCLMLAACAGQTSPEDAQMAATLSAQGKILLKAGKNSEARDVYASATNRDSHNAQAWNGLGVSLELIGKKADAENAYLEAINLNPGELAARNNLAHLYLTEGKADKAVDLLTPYADSADAPKTVKQTFTAAKQAANAKPLDTDTFADLGSYPTEGLARAHLSEARDLLGRDAKGLTFTVDPEIKVAGGTPVFTVRARGKAAQEICDELTPQAFPCLPNGH